MKELNVLLKSEAKLTLSQATVINIFYTASWIKDELLINLN